MACLLFRVGGEQEAPRVGIVIVEGQTEYRAAPDVQEHFAPPREVLEADAFQKGNLPDERRPVHPEAGLAMLHRPALADVAWVGIFCCVVKDVVCRDVFDTVEPAVLLEARLALRQVQEMQDLIRRAIVVVVGEGDHVGVLLFGCCNAQFHELGMEEVIRVEE